MDRRLIIEAKFYSLYKIYDTFFSEQSDLNEKTVYDLTSTIPNDALIIRYVYYSIHEYASH